MFKSKIRAWVLILLFSLTAHLGTEAQKIFQGLPFMENFKPDEYGGGMQNFMITQDNRGVLLIANNMGMLTFDGNHWHQYSIPTVTKIRSLQFDHKNRVYVGCQGDIGFFEPDQKGSWQYQSLKNKIPEAHRNIDETWKVYTSDDKVYFVTIQKIYVYQNDSIEVITADHNIEQSLFFQNKLYLTILDEGLFHLEGKTLKMVPGGQRFAESRGAVMIEYDKDQMLIIDNKKGFFLYNGVGFQKLNTLSQLPLSNLTFRCGIRMRDGSLVLGTETEGLIILNANGQLNQQITKENGLPSRFINDVYQDNLGNLWVGMNNGLTYLEFDSPFTIIDEKVGLPGTGYDAFVDGDLLYMATNNGVFVYNGHSYSTNEQNIWPVVNTSGQIYQLDKLQNKLLVGAHNGPFVIENNTATRIGPEVGSWIFKSPPNHPDIMIGGNYNGIHLYRYENNQWEYQFKYEKLNESSRVLAFEDENTLWMTHGYKGAYKIIFEEDYEGIMNITYYNEKDGFPSNILINVFRINNKLVFGTQEGIYTYNTARERFEPHPDFSKWIDPDQPVYEMEQDFIGNIYYYNLNNLAVLEKDGIDSYIQNAELFTKIRAMLNDDLVKIIYINNQNLFFTAKEGFIHYNPSRPFSIATPFDALIRRVESNGKGDSTLFFGNFKNNNKLSTIQSKEHIPEIRYNQNNITITYAANFFDSHQSTEFQYYLEGYDPSWSEWSKKTYKEYTNLPEGSYTFHVKAKNIYGNISSNSKYYFKILPPWYRSPTAYTIYFLLLAGSLFGTVAYFDRKFKNEKRAITLEKEREISRKDRELQEVTTEKEEEIVKLRNEKLRNEIDHMNKELASSTMHLMNKNELIGGIKNKLNSILKKERNEMVKKVIRQIIKDIDHNIDLDQDWDQFELHFDQVHGDFMKRIKMEFPGLTPQERKLTAYLRMNLSSKEIAQLLNISVRGVEIGRYRLRKKLSLERETNLTEYIMNY